MKWPAWAAAVGSFDELAATAFSGPCNALCWERRLDGDFGEVARALTQSQDLAGGVTSVEPARLDALDVSSAGRVAVLAMLADLDRLRGSGHAPEISLVAAYPHDPDEVLPTHVYSFHVDRADVPTDTFLCSYTSPASEGLGPLEARRAVDVPAIRSKLFEQFQSSGSGSGMDVGPGAFAAYLRDLHYDLHFIPGPNASPHSFGVGHLWRIAVEYEGSPVAACIHRAPMHSAAQGPRLLLIS